ncbi:MAG TPA: hypothetical protein VGU74_04165 [Gemmatimonadales bacterium]|nr:hypothetical protein [Gemmatimonadales bacterium]
MQRLPPVVRGVELAAAGWSADAIIKELKPVMALTMEGTIEPNED